MDGKVAYSEGSNDSNSHVVKEFPLRLVLIAPFVLQIVLAVGLTGYLSLRNGQKAVNDLARQLSREVGARIDQQLDSYLSIPLILSQTNQDAIRLGLFDGNDTETQGRYFWKQVKAARVGYILFGDQSGRFLAAGHFFGDERITIDEVNRDRYGNYHLYIHETDEQGNRTGLVRDSGDMFVNGKFSLHEEGWYTAATQKGGPAWTAVYNWSVDPFPLAIATSRPVYDQDKNLIGIVAVEQQLSQINDFFKRVQVSPSGKAFIMERSGLLIASSSDEQPFTLEKDKPNRLNATDSKDPLIQASATYLAKQFDNFKNVQGVQQLSFSMDGELQFVQVTPWQDELGLDWLVVVAVPESDFMAQINDNTRITIFLCLGALGVAIGLGIYTSRWIAKPILTLSEASQAIAVGDLKQTVKVQGVKELSTLAESFNLMATKLQASFADLKTVNADLAHQTEQLSSTNEMLQQEILERHQVEEQLRYGALHDALTHCPNRACLMEHLDMALKRMQRQAEYLFAVLFIDVDRFKVVNDSLGHQVGDQLLISVAQQLGAVVRETDIVARLGGDEFVILLDPIEHLNNAIQIADRIHQKFQLPFELESRQVFTTVSIGIVLGSPNYQYGDDLLRDADIALYRAKARGKSRSEIFNQEMFKQALVRHQLENDLRLGFERQEFQAYYQPIVDLQTEQITGFEALSRWHHPVNGWISPAQFIPVAEETGLIVPLGEWVLRSACQQMVAWQAMFAMSDPLTISVNLSVAQLKDPSFLVNLDEILLQTGLSGQQLHLELTESMLMENVEELIDLLTQLRARDIQLSIDDFGTGYSSLSYLHRFPITMLKIDRSFVSRMGQQGESQEIVETIIHLAHQLDMVAIAEGVETPIQLDYLKRFGCEQAQGYLFSRPLPQKAAAAVLAPQAC